MMKTFVCDAIIFDGETPNGNKRIYRKDTAKEIVDLVNENKYSSRRLVILGGKTNEVEDMRDQLNVNWSDVVGSISKISVNQNDKITTDMEFTSDRLVGLVDSLTILPFGTGKVNDKGEVYDFTLLYFTLMPKTMITSMEDKDGQQTN